jgi:hypothetical protein
VHLGVLPVPDPVHPGDLGPEVVAVAVGAVAVEEERREVVNEILTDNQNHPIEIKEGLIENIIEAQNTEKETTAPSPKIDYVPVKPTTTQPPQIPLPNGITV